MARIFVVDDEPLVAQAIGEVLIEAGHDVLFPHADADLAEEALGQSYDLLLTDVLLPEISGWDLIRTLRRHRPTLPVVAISGGGAAFDPEVVLKISQLIGADATLAKPVAGNVLVMTIERLLREHHKPH